ncbi:MAG: DCC1-like thiol-disulfide oxidoreductase family protein [Myxococcota bacterium]
MAWVRRNDSRGQFDFEPFQDTRDPRVHDALRERCRDALYVLPIEGAPIHSARALLFVGRRIGFGWITWIGWIPPVTQLLEVGYRFMARNRPLFARWLFRSETGGPFSRP